MLHRHIREESVAFGNDCWELIVTTWDFPAVVSLIYLSNPMEAWNGLWLYDGGRLNLTWSYYLLFMTMGFNNMEGVFQSRVLFCASDDKIRMSGVAPKRWMGVQRYTTRVVWELGSYSDLLMRWWVKPGRKDNRALPIMESAISAGCTISLVSWNFQSLYSLATYPWM